MENTPGHAVPPDPTSVKKLSIEKIYASPHQMRRQFDPVALKELARSIKQEGLIQPITVRQIGQAFELVVGERRLRAVQLLGWETIDARVIEASDEDAAVKGLIENLQRQDLTPIEEARGYKQLLDPPYSMTQEAIGARVGRSQTAIARGLALLELPEEIQVLMPRGIISEAHTRYLRKIDDRSLQVDLAKQVDRLGLTVKETERRVNEILKQEGKPINRRQLHRRGEPRRKASVLSDLDPLGDTWAQLLYTPHVGTPGTWNARYEGSGQWAIDVWAEEEDARAKLSDFFIRLGMALGSRPMPNGTSASLKNAPKNTVVPEAN